MANFDRSYIKKILCPHTQMITWEASSLLGPDFYVTVHYSTFSATFCCARTGTGTGNRVIAILEPWNRITIFPVLVTCLSTCTAILPRSFLAPVLAKGATSRVEIKLYPQKTVDIFLNLTFFVVKKSYPPKTAIRQ